MVALYITPVITGAIFYLINNHLTNFKTHKTPTESLSQSLPDTDSYTSLLMPLFYPFIGAVVTMFIVNLWLAQDSAYKSKKELYINLQKAYRIKTQDTSLKFNDFQGSYFDTLKGAMILNYLYEKFFYRFETVDKKIELLKKCIENEKLSRYVK